MNKSPVSRQALAFLMVFNLCAVSLMLRYLDTSLDKLSQETHIKAPEMTESIPFSSDCVRPGNGCVAANDALSAHKNSVPFER